MSGEKRTAESGLEPLIAHVHVCDGTGRRVPVGRMPLIIGSAEGSGLVLGEPTVSRKHAEVVWSEASGKVLVRDMGSRNGTFVGKDNRRIAEQLLGDGDEFRCGSALLRVGIGGPAAKPGAPLSAEPSASLRGRGKPRLIERLPPRIPEEIRRYKEQVADVLRQRLDRSGTEGGETPDKLRARVERAISELMREFTPPENVKREQIRESLLDDLLGYGPLQPYLNDDDITEIMVNRESVIFIERRGKIEYAGDCFASRNQLMNVIERIVNQVNRKINESSPLVDARLPDGSRVNVIIPPLALDGPCLTIRKFRKEGFGIHDLVRYGSMSGDMADFLQVCVENRLNILISGGTGSGKTTLLNVLSSFISDSERIVTIEDSAELRLPQFHVVRLETRPENIEGKGRVAIRDLVINALRMRPDRIVVGECRGGEALDMIQAMNTGHDGSLTTVHANSPRDALRRLEVMCLMAGVDLPMRAIREQLVAAIQIVVQIGRFSDGSRKVIQISEVSGMQQDVISMQDIFKFHDHGLDANARRMGEHLPTGIVPSRADEFREKGVALDLSMFKKKPDHKEARA